METKRAKTGGRKAGTLNKVTAEVRTLAQQHGEDAIQTLASIMRDPTRNETARIAAARELLDRGYGKPGVDGVTVLPSLTTDERPVFTLTFLTAPKKEEKVIEHNVQDVDIYDTNE